MRKLESLIRQWNTKSDGVKASIAFLFASLVASGISYLSTPIYTRLLTSVEYGQVSLFMTWQNLLGIIAMFCLSAGVFNNGMIEYKKDYRVFSFSLLILSNVITIVLGIGLFLFKDLSDKYIGLSPKYLLVMFGLFLVQPAYNFWTQKERFLYKYKQTVIATICVAVLSPLGGILGIILFSNKIDGRIFGSEVILILFYIIFYFNSAKESHSKINLDYCKFALAFNAPLIPHYLSMYLLSNSDKIMISKLVGDEATAFYSIAYTVASVVLMVWAAVNASLIPYTYEKCKQEEFGSISKVTLPILFLFLCICVGFTMVAPELVALMATREYLEAVVVIPPVVVGVFFQVHYSIYANILYYYKKQKYVMYGSVFATIFNLVLNYIFIPRYGYIAAGYTTLFCYILQAMIDFFALKYVIKEEIFNTKYLMVLSIIMLFVGGLSIIIYDYTIVRYSILVVLVVVTFLFREKIKSIFKVVKNKG